MKRRKRLKTPSLATTLKALVVLIVIVVMFFMMSFFIRDIEKSNTSTADTTINIPVKHSKIQVFPIID